MQNNQKKVAEIAARHLGKKGGEGYSTSYDPKLLVAIPRKLNREAYGIDEKDLPFCGFDVWNAYEVSALTSKGCPVTGMLKIVCNARSKYHVESKSIKLYLNSFNMTRLGDTIEECIELIERRVAEDLSELLDSPVLVKFFNNANDETRYDVSTGSTADYSVEPPFPKSTSVDPFWNYDLIQSQIDLNTIKFDTYKSDKNQLETGNGGFLKTRIDFLRSNCRVTNQPDWGDIYIHIEGKEVPSLESLAKYVVSHRTVSHFHEEIAEMVYKHLLDRFSPDKLMVACLYSRRGGIDINPIRATDIKLIDGVFYSLTSRLRKTLKQ